MSASRLTRDKRKFMDEMSNKVSESDLMKALLSWRLDNISSDQLRKIVDQYLQVSPRFAETPADAELVSVESRVPAIRTFASLEAEDAQRASLTPAYKAPSFEEHESVPYEPMPDVVDEPRGAWIPDGWGLYYMIDDWLYRISFGFVTVLNLTILLGFLIIIGVLFGAWQISTSSERQKKASYKTMVPSGSSRDKQRDATEPLTPAEPASTNPLNGESGESNGVSEKSDDSTSTNSSTGEAPTAFKSSGSNNSSLNNSSPNDTALNDSGNDKVPNLSSAILTSSFDKVLALMEASDHSAALKEIETLEAGDTAELQPVLTYLKIESLIQKRDNDSMELARQALMDCDSVGHELVFDLLVSRWMLMCSSQARERFLRESASLAIENRSRMVNWAKVRSGAFDAILESELESNAPRTPNAVCDRLFLASCRFNAGKGEQTRRELLDVELKLRSLNTRGFG